MRLSWIYAVLLAACAAGQNADEREQLEAALQLVSQMPPCAVCLQDQAPAKHSDTLQSKIASFRQFKLRDGLRVILMSPRVAATKQLRQGFRRAPWCVIQYHSTIGSET